MKPTYSRLCFTTTVYAFLLYATHASDEELAQTFFVFGHTFPRSVAQRVPHSYQVPPIRREGPTFRWINWMRYRWNFSRHLPRLTKDVQIFAQDHQLAAAVLIGKRPYTFIEDSRLVLTNVYERQVETKRMQRTRAAWNYPLMRRMYGPLMGREWATSSQCRSLLVTEVDPHPSLASKQQIVAHAMNHALWQTFSSSKQAFLLHAFDITDDDLRVLQSYENILLTQPLWTDIMSYDEHRQCYARILSHYPEGSVIIKTHPREQFPYEKEFPTVPVFSKVIPCEMFNLLGTQFRRVITVFSTAVNQFGPSVQIDWFGASIHPALQRYAEIKPPARANIVS